MFYPIADEVKAARQMLGSYCGFRYNARGIARRYFCNECRRKFSIKYFGPIDQKKASTELLWTMNQVAAAMARLDDLLLQVGAQLKKVSETKTGWGSSAHFT
jgi:hypothetical protein